MFLQGMTGRNDQDFLIYVAKLNDKIATIVFCLS